MQLLRSLTAAAAAAASLAAHHHHPVPQWPTPAWFFPQALCVHDGWHYARATAGQRADYAFGRLRFVRSWHVPPNPWADNGEGSWGAADGQYRFGLQFMLGTWERAGGSARSWWATTATPAEQIYRAYVIVVRQDGGSWREWPNTARACALPT